MAQSKPYPKGTRINDRYELVAFLGKGKGGQVHRARDEHLGTEVALKLLTPTDGQPATWDEAQVLEQLRSDYLLPVFNADVVTGTDLRYITTPVMEGGNLSTAASPFGVTPRQASEWGQYVGYGLEKVHSAGLLHRDVKPENCYLDTNGKVLLADLGMAHKIDKNGRTPPEGTLVTVAPEALSSPDRHCTKASDIYSLAATVFFLLAGDYPVSEKFGYDETWEKVRTGQRSKLRDVAPHVSIGLSRVVEKSLSLDPNERATSPLEFANQLATATHHRRNWRRITPHANHLRCMVADSTKTASTLNICVVAEGNDFAVVATLDSGRRVRKHERTGVKASKIAQTLREIIGKV
ncbi:serine/threonine protein kinase [Amycolatopsis balhimycina DSM 5908]|uniref:Serine/threonine protein kinase n=1 Tax=Amycolatopsis balhimycina DSM 5908 TaxID=1081091 RepID=A0A428VYD6_AMYBA|nr:serine/threonine-protein kinase [Amycolatopsis balhimycina]RSM35787.1 serine/threonine protein kinase [Amycolatopsis balhimycina DSM 5908]